MYVVRKYFRTLESTFVRRYLRTSVLPYERTTDSRVQLYVYSTVHVPSKQLLLNNPKKKMSMGTCTLYSSRLQRTRTRTTVVHLHYEGTFVLSKVLSYNVVCVHR